MGLLSIPLSFLPLLAIRLTAIAMLLTHHTAQTPHAPLLSGHTPQSALEPVPNAESQPSHTATLLSQRVSNRPQVGVSVPAIARQVTVRILTNPGIGSGVIIERRGQTYTVVTCAHVVADTKDNRYTILTADGQQHNGRRLRSAKFLNADLALVQFTSDQAYRVAAIADSRALAIGDPIYASGFPNWHWTNSNAVEETRDWGTKAFRLTSGKVAMLPERSLQEGYQLGYTNDVEQGMSGGPVLDQYGRLIGINGRLKYPPQGTIAFIFEDGTVPSEKIFQQMEALSWAIPTATFWQALK